MNDTVVLGGDANLQTQIDGELSLSQCECVDADVVFVKRELVYPAYTGSTSFIPSAEAQTIETSEKTVFENITINPIPSNYGLITWNGSTLMVS